MIKFWRRRKMMAMEQTDARRYAAPAPAPFGAEPWHGTELAFDQLEALFYQIKGAIQPERADIIDQATNSGLEIVKLLQQWWQSLPPGAAAASNRPASRPKKINAD